MITPTDLTDQRPEPPADAGADRRDDGHGDSDTRLERQLRVRSEVRNLLRRLNERRLAATS